MICFYVHSAGHTHVAEKHAPLATTSPALQVDGNSSYSLRTTGELVGFNNPESEDRSSFPGRYRGGKGAVGGLSMRRSHNSMDGQGPMVAGGSRNG